MNEKNKLSQSNINKYYEQCIAKFNQKSLSVQFTLEDYENFKYLIKSLNNLAIEGSHQNPKRSYSYLTKANTLSTILWKKVKKLKIDSELIKSSAQLRSLTLNNLACHFKACEKLSASLGYLEKAAAIEKKGAVDEYEIATTLINITTILSKLSNHETALIRSQEAVEILERVDELTEITEALSAAYFNHAVELEYVKRLPEAKLFYSKAYELCLRKLGESHKSSQGFLEKLVQFNVQYALVEADPKSLQETASMSQSSFFTIKKPSLEILHSDYLVLMGLRFKVFVLNKKLVSAFKILAFPKERYPVYKYVCSYHKAIEISQMCTWADMSKPTNEEMKECCKRLLEHMIIEKGGIKFLSFDFKN